MGLLVELEPASVQSVRSALERTGHEVAYTTVLTVLTRLHEKGVVAREKDGRRHVYRLAKRTPALTERLVSRVQRALFPRDRARPILALLDDESLSDRDLRALRAKIDERLGRKR